MNNGLLLNTFSVFFTSYIKKFWQRIVWPFHVNFGPSKNIFCYSPDIVLFTPESFYPNASRTTLIQDAIFYSGNGGYRREPGWSCWYLFGKGFTLAMLVMLATLVSSSTSISSSSTATVTIWSSSSYTETSIQKISHLFGRASNILFHCSTVPVAKIKRGRSPKIHIGASDANSILLWGHILTC